MYSDHSSKKNGPHPQFHIIKKHIDRAVQDLFLKALREQPDELSYIFNDTDQIESFCQRMIKYWESNEDYEICSEIQSLSKKFKSNWTKSEIDLESRASKLVEMFKNHI
jgi:hypothetical protein